MMERIETGLWGWAIFGLALAYVAGLIILKRTDGMDWLLALAATRR